MADFLIELTDDDTFDADEVIPGLLVGSAWYTAGMLAKHGVTHVLNVSADIKPDVKVISQIPYLHVPIKDDLSTNALDLFPLAIKYMDLVLEEAKAKLLVHCTVGVSRSVTFVCAYLLFKYPHQFSSAFEAIKKVKASRRVADPNPNFVGQLKLWKEANFNPSDPKIELNAVSLNVASPTIIFSFPASVKKSRLKKEFRKDKRVRYVKVK